MSRRPITNNGVEIGVEFEAEFPIGDGCCQSGIAISHGVQVYDAHQGQGLGTKAHQERLDRLRTKGYNYVLCTVRRDNAKQIHILHKFGWVKLVNTSNADGTPIYLYGKNLR